MRARFATDRWIARVAPLAREVVEAFARRHRRGARRGAGQDHGLRYLRQGQLAAQSGRRGGEGRHAGRHVVGDAERVEPPHLLGDRAVERRVAGMDARDVSAAACAAAISAMISSSVSGAVSTTRAPAGAACDDRAAAPASRHRGTPGSARSGRRPRTVIRSGAPGPAPMKCTVTRPSPSAWEIAARRVERAASRPATRRVLLHCRPAPATACRRLAAASSSSRTTRQRLAGAAEIAGDRHRRLGRAMRTSRIAPPRRADRRAGPSAGCTARRRNRRRRRPRAGRGWPARGSAGRTARWRRNRGRAARRPAPRRPASR